ncbi:hypothetical protein PR001_g30523 [Phytophthora rubi]|uniref:Uncharacterized protein n=1 Tax=Phytophthora rubi TaxID=129364 RepID=A0A6A3GSP4_9STRA|nr:hypothetical protein PR001_g30523 [Phytophthora rubi]
MQMAPTTFVLQPAWHDANSDGNIRVNRTWAQILFCGTSDKFDAEG